jgi:hypothetical protein
MTTQREYLMDKCAEYGIPSHMHNALVSYCIDGRPTSGFLRLLIDGDLFGCLGRADPKNRESLYSYALFFYNARHGAPYGYKGAYKSWLDKKAEEREAEVDERNRIIDKGRR